MHTLLDILAAIGLVFILVAFLRWLFAPSRSHRPSQHDKAATLWYLFKHHDRDDS